MITSTSNAESKRLVKFKEEEKIKENERKASSW